MDIFIFYLVSVFTVYSIWLMVGAASDQDFEKRRLELKREEILDMGYSIGLFNHQIQHMSYNDVKWLYDNAYWINRANKHRGYTDKILNRHFCDIYTKHFNIEH